MTTFVHPPDVRFTCSRCGDCCRTWDVGVSPAEREVLEGLDWEGKAQDLVDQRPTVAVRAKGMEGYRRLSRRDDGSCIYLGAEQQCRIHEHFDAASKPLMCRLYPFGFYPVGEKIGVDVAFSCSAVSAGRGEALEARIPEWTQRLAETGSEEQSGPQAAHRLRSKAKLTPVLLWELEHQLVAFLEDRGMTLFERVRCVLQWTRIATTGDPSLPTAAQMRTAMATGIVKQTAGKPSKETLDRTQRAFFFQWLYVSLNPAPSHLQELSGKALKAEQKNRIARANRYRDPEKCPWIDEREWSVNYRQIAAVDLGVLKTSPNDRNDLLTIWLRAKILGQRFLIDDGRERPFTEAVPRFLMVYPMALWTAKALAAERGATECSWEDLRGAIRWIDRTLGRLPSSHLPRKQAEAADFLLSETALVEGAVNDLMTGLL